MSWGLILVRRIAIEVVLVLRMMVEDSMLGLVVRLASVVGCVMEGIQRVRIVEIWSFSAVWSAIVYSSLWLVILIRNREVLVVVGCSLMENLGCLDLRLRYTWQA